LGFVVTVLAAALIALYLVFGILQKVKWQRLVMKALENEEAMATY
jgi:hypothetical protein